MPRARSVASRRYPAAIAVCVTAWVAAPLLIAQAVPAPAGTLARIREAGRIRLGYRADARPFAFKDESGQPAGYSIALCQRIADAAKREPGFEGVKVDWVPTAVDDRFRALQQGQIDLLCGAETVTLAKRAEVSFSLPIFPGGIAALVRSDAPARLREVLSGRGQTYHPTWRASAAQALHARAFVAVAGTTAETWLKTRTKELAVVAAVAPVESYDAGVRRLLERTADAFFGERAVLLDAAQRHASARDLLVVDRLFTFEPLAIAFQRGDDDFRLFVDRTLSRLTGSGEMSALYSKWFGEPDESALAFFRWNTLSD